MKESKCVIDTDTLDVKMKRLSISKRHNGIVKQALQTAIIRHDEPMILKLYEQIALEQKNK